MKNEKLTNLNIDLASKKIEGFLSQNKVEGKNIIRIKLAAEETLLKLQEKFGEQAAFSLKCVKRLGSLKVEIILAGERFDPFEQQEDEYDSDVLRSMLSYMGIAPAWQYKNGLNIVTFTPKKKKPSQMKQMVVAILLALVMGGISNLVPDIMYFISLQIITPIFNTFMGLLTAISGPMIFLSVTWGIYSIGDTSTFGKIGKRMIIRYIVMTLIVTSVVLLAYIPFFDIQQGSGGAFNFSELFDMILDIIPNNFFTPFTEGNPLQIIFVAVAVGLAVLILGNKTAVATTFIEQSNYIVQLIMEAITSLIPFFIFGSIFTMIVGGNISLLASAYKLLPIMLLGHLIAIAIYTLLVCFNRKISPSLLYKKMMPTFLIGLFTASAAAAYATNAECCEKDLGIDKKIINFGIPLGQVVFMPGASILFLAAGICMAEVYGVSLSITWLITALIITVVLAIAAPPVPGGALTCYTILFMQLEIPPEAIAITIALNLILEFAATAVNLFCLQTELIELSASLDILDYAKLRAPK